jgi:protein-disulfide isomerase
MRKKKISQRQQRLKIRRKQEKRKRFITIFLVVIAAALFMFVLVYTNLRSAGEIATIEAFPRPMENGVAMGDPDAPVVIDVFEDFQCPACKLYTQDVERRIVETYVASGQVYYVFHHFPFLDRASATQESHQAANASMCAMEQDRFWDYHDILFANWNGENIGSFGDDNLIAFAETLGLDMDTFTPCFEENRYQEEIQADFNLGLEMGVSGTPSVFVNGQHISPTRIPTFADLQQAVEAVLNQPTQ